MRKTPLLITSLALLVAWLAAGPGGARAAAPPGFIGISPQNSLEAQDFELMQEAGIKRIRLPLVWAGVESTFPPSPDWSGFDYNVALAAEHGMSIFPFVYGSPSWVASNWKALPAWTKFQRRAWAGFLHQAVRRYGPGGWFWREHPDLPYIPIRNWEIWNEENIIAFTTRPDPKRYTTLLKIAGRVLHRADHGAKVILGGFFGHPLNKVPPNVKSEEFLDSVYQDPSVKRYFDGIGLHPYVAMAGQMRAEIGKLRRVMRAHHDGATPIYITELGWGSDNGPTRWERGMRGQAQQLNQSISLLLRNRRRWRIAWIDWFTWMDQPSGCQFCNSSGLLTSDRLAKPSWYRFNAWTRGDPFTVPRLKNPLSRPPVG